ncbi:MAG: hypothetical protein Q8K32_07260 [Archangium sp.]|nr:hypothetical protein [Archangium sp.]
MTTTEAASTLTTNKSLRGDAREHAADSALVMPRWTPTLFFDQRFLAMKFHQGQAVPATDPQPRLLIDARTDLFEATLEMEQAALELEWAHERGEGYAPQALRQRHAARAWYDALQALYAQVEMVEDGWGSPEYQPFLRFLNPIADAARLEKTAFHEAGHAVVGVFLGMELGDVTIIPDPEGVSLGAVSIRHRPPNPWPSQVAVEVIMSFAGHYAACRRFPGHVPDGWQADWLQARALIAGQAKRSSQRRKMEQDLRERSLWFVYQLWPSIGDLAFRLLRKKTVRVVEVEKSFSRIPRARRQSLIDHPWALRQAMASDFEAELRRCAKNAPDHDLADVSEIRSAA